MANKYTKITNTCTWTSLIIREMQIKMRYHLTSVKKAISKRLEITSADEKLQKREHVYTVGEDVNWAVPMENCMEVL